MKRLLVCMILLLPLAAMAQNDLPANVNLQFRFKNPGARAQAMGGAFVGLADDTTAIFANPAGLTRITGSTIALEVDHNRADNPIPFFGGRIQQIGLQDFRFDLESRDFPNDTTSVPFLGYVRADARVKWGVYYAELANFERAFDTEGVAVPTFEGGRDVVQSSFHIFFPTQNNISLKMRSLGASLAGKLTKTLAAGLTLSYNQLDYQGQTTLYFPDIEQMFPEINFDPRTIEVLRELVGLPTGRADVSGDDGQGSVYAGLMWTPHERFSFGVAYKQQPEFDYDYVLSEADDDNVLVPFENGAGVFNMPDSFGAGFSFKPSDVFVLSLEINRIVYSELSDDYVKFFPVDEDPIGATQVADDATEYRVGMEYIVTSTRFPLALRAGYWVEPYHALRNTTTDTQLLFRYLDQSDDYVQSIRPTAFLQQFAQDETHYTVGLGLTFGRHLALDLSGDIADTTQSYSLSGIYRF